MDKNTSNEYIIAKLNRELSAVKQMYNDLHCDDQRKMLALDNVPVFELTIDKDANITNLSKGFETVMEATREEYLNKPFSNLLADKDEITKHYASLDQFKKTGVINKKQWRMLKKNGEIIFVMHSARAIYDNAGDFNGAVGFVLDISETVYANKALMRSEHEKRLILDVMPEGVVYIDSEMNIIWANKIVSDYFGDSSIDLSGKKCIEVCPTAYEKCSTCPIRKVLSTKTKQMSEITYGDTYCVMRVNPVFNLDNEVISMVVLISDITERKLLERQIVELSNDERKRIGHDLHDGLGQMLSAISVMSSSLLDIMDNKSGQEYELAKKLVYYTQESQTLMRSILDGICPVMGVTQNLKESLTCLVSRLSTIFNVKYSVSFDPKIKFDNKNSINHLFMIAQEAVNNAVKHSGCSEINITTYISEGSNFLSISDNGKGTDLSIRKEGYGFRIMNYRASVIGALLSIKSSQDSGTVVTVKM